jgi:hypothetical protein
VCTVSKTQEGLNHSFIASATTVLSKVVLWIGLGSMLQFDFFLFFLSISFQLRKKKEQTLQLI